MMASPWLPDFIARWYDAFVQFHFHPDVRHWRSAAAGPEVSHWERRLCSSNPHVIAAEMDKWIRKGGGEVNRLTYRALQAVSAAFLHMGVATVRVYGNAGWEEIRDRWGACANLLREEEGALLPDRPIPYRWSTEVDRRKKYNVRSHFPNFVRWFPTRSDAPVVDFRVLSSTEYPVEGLVNRLTIGLAPLIESTADLTWDPITSASGHASFRVSLRDEDAVSSALARAIASAEEQSCDVVLMPELCLTPRLQDEVRAATRASFHRSGYPWLVIAGTALTPTGEPDRYHNRARVFDGHGDEVLVYNKLHPYEMSTREATRYGVADAFGGIDLEEDISTTPRRFSVLETPIGRVGVMICEDLSVEPFVIDLIDGLALDWLFVPVMDGCQCSGRWTDVAALRGANYGSSVVIATTPSLYQAHLEDYDRRGEDRPKFSGIGLLARPGQGPGSIILGPGGRYDGLVAVSCISA